jgi:hypothetical protein
VLPVAVAPLPTRGRRGRLGGVALQPPPHLVVVVLLAPQQAGERLPLHEALVVVELRAGECRVELVGLLLPRGEHGVGVIERESQVGGREAHGDDQGLARAEHGLDVRGRLAAGRAIDGGRVPVDHEVADAVLRMVRRVRRREQPTGIGLVLAEQEVGLRTAGGAHVQPAVAERGMGRPRDAVPFTGDPRGRGALLPRPRVPVPQVRQHMDRRRIGTAIGGRDAAQDVLGRRLRVLDHDVEVAVRTPVALERVEELVLGLLRAPGAVGVHEVRVRERRLRVLVDHGRVGMRGQVVGVEPVVLDVLAVVALLVGHAEGALLQDVVRPVPQGQAQADRLIPVAPAGEPVLVPAVGPAPRVIEGEVRPCVAVGAVVLADGAPGALTEVGAPPTPVACPGPRLGQPIALSRGHAAEPSWRRISEQHRRERADLAEPDGAIRLACSRVVVVHVQRHLRSDPGTRVTHDSGHAAL